MDEILNSNLIWGLIPWMLTIILTGYIAKMKNYKPFGWIILSVFFGFIPLIILSLLRNRSKSFEKEPLSKEESRLRYLKMKEEFEMSKKQV